MKQNFCLLISLCVLHWTESVEAEKESVLGYRLIGEGNCVSDNSQTKHPGAKMFQTMDACAAQCTQLNNCVRFVFDANEKEKPNCWLKTSACTVDESLGKIVYEKRVTEVISLHIPELDDLNSTSCVTSQHHDLNGTQLSNGWYYPWLVEAYKSPADIEKWNDVILVATFSDLQVSYGICGKLEMFYTSFVVDSGAKNCAAVRKCTAVVSEENTTGEGVGHKDCKYVCECPVPPCPIDFIVLENQMRFEWKLCEVSAIESDINVAK